MNGTRSVESLFGFFFVDKPALTKNFPADLTAACEWLRFTMLQSFAAGMGTRSELDTSIELFSSCTTRFSWVPRPSS